MVSWGGMFAAREDEMRIRMEAEATEEEWAAYDAHMAARAVEISITATRPGLSIDFDLVPF